MGTCVWGSLCKPMQASACSMQAQDSASTKPLILSPDFLLHAGDASRPRHRGRTAQVFESQPTQPDPGNQEPAYQPPGGGADPTSQPARTRPPSGTKRARPTPVRAARRAASGQSGEYSVTISKQGREPHVTDADVEKVRVFFEEKFSDCYLGVEWGDIMGRRHMQCVVRDTASHYLGGASLNAALKGVLGWTNEGGFRSTIMVRALAYTHLHTWIGMIGYCSKYEGNQCQKCHSYAT